MNTICHWPEEDRPREKFVNRGAMYVTDAELIAILLRSGTADKTALDLSRSILKDANNSLHELSGKSVGELMKVNGVGLSKAVSIMAALEISKRRSLENKDLKKAITSSNDAYMYLRAHLVGLDHEEFFILLLNRANAIIAKERISVGGISGTVADGKIIFKKAIQQSASGIIVAHNHPSGQLKPSEADKKLTNSLVCFGKMIDLQIVDHLIITDNGYFSFVDHGIL
jgi:DNA repair protein RadC